MNESDEKKPRYDKELAAAIPSFVICEGRAVAEELRVRFLALPELQVGAELKINGEPYQVTGRGDNKRDDQSVIRVRPKEPPPGWVEPPTCAT